MGRLEDVQDMLAGMSPREIEDLLNGVKKGQIAACKGHKDSRGNTYLDRDPNNEGFLICTKCGAKIDTNNLVQSSKEAIELFDKIEDNLEFLRSTDPSFEDAKAAKELSRLLDTNYELFSRIGKILDRASTDRRDRDRNRGNRSGNGYSNNRTYDPFSQYSRGNNNNKFRR